MKSQIFDLKLSGTPLDFGDTQSLETYRFPNGKGFPDSYKDFVLTYGYGVALGEFLIYIPMEDYGDSLFVRSEEIKSTYIEDVYNNDIWFELEPDGSPELLKRLLPFASSENGLYLFWDYESNPQPHEFDIYLTDFRGTGFKKVGGSLYRVINNLTHNGSEHTPVFNNPKERIFKCLQRQDL